MDREDALACFRERFVIDDQDLIYLDGNSLGRQPKRAADLVSVAAEQQWAKRLVTGWPDSWYTLPQRLGAKIAGLIGAREDEVIVADSTSVNFFKLAHAALMARPGGSAILTDRDNFPSDVYLLQGLLEVAPGHRLRIAETEGATGESNQVLAGKINADTALVTVSHTAFKSGFVYDMTAITEAAHRHGALVLWDLSHSVGAMPVDLEAAGADMAVGCTYKYLNGGPGSPAFLYVRRELQAQLTSPIWGWFGQRAPFDFSLEYEPAPGIRRFMAGTPPILSMVAIEAGVDLLLEAGMERIRAKSVCQTEYLIALWREFLQPLGISLNSPTESAKRGSHVSFGHPDGLRIDKALIEQMNVIPDFRFPDNIRYGIAPLYTTYREIWEGVARLKQVVEEKLYERYSSEKPEVT